MSATKAVYLMARLTTKGVPHGASFGGIPELSRTDIAAACTRLQPLHFHLIMAKYCDDVRSAIQALGELQEEMCYQDSLWADMEPMRRSYVAAAMIEEFVGAKKCRKCKGSGETKEAAKIVECSSCGGNGNRLVSEASRARACEIPKSTFRDNRMMRPYEGMMIWLSDIEARALERISRKAS
ncbi:hypothetical protein SAMN04488490_1846 [Marinobacter sp. LV10R510-11A]|uniref:hypothetical protein n=1 Tax=Marinobacter sp. LV10R510-11A TaxID=1415568 RepID=UPI000BBFC776|nr:hypothetical protein [Marinobacter sp. LV10R510-11A]SOB76168.1 hypothetical protein SAMN04488490_1846 [Marinobacter sp. LV10R510-11A]